MLAIQLVQRPRRPLAGRTGHASSGVSEHSNGAAVFLPVNDADAPSNCIQASPFMEFRPVYTTLLPSVRASAAVKFVVEPLVVVIVTLTTSAQAPFTQAQCRRPVHGLPCAASLSLFLNLKVPLSE